MNEKQIYVIYSDYHHKYFGGMQGIFKKWVRTLDDSYWFLTMEKAKSTIDRMNLNQCVIKPCTAIYPDGIEPYARLNK